jgi:RNase H-fold protein (predicted Holliday junction resolvase)
MIVLGVDPGREKCGLAVVSSSGVIIKRVVPRAEFLPVAKELLAEHNVERVILGDGTGSTEFMRELTRALPGLDLAIIDEQHSTEEARERYWQNHRPRGWRRALPITMQVPPEPYDDYVAVILAERFFSRA